MPSIAGDNYRRERATMIKARLIARGLNPRSNGFHRAFFKAMRRV